MFFNEIYLKVLSIDGASRILDGIKDEVHMYEDIFALCFRVKWQFLWSIKCIESYMKICSIVMLEVHWIVLGSLPSKHLKKSSWYPSLDTPCTRACTVRMGSSVNSLDTPWSRGLGVGSRDPISSEVSSWYSSTSIESIKIDFCA